MDYTPEQLAAICTIDRNVIVIAGAGSGKTRVLVDRFVTLLEVNPDWPLSSLVAITFTEKAAREMRDRVRQAIEARIEACGPDQRAELARWRAHQAALDSARIGTIHALCASLLRANAAFLGIDPGFTVLDEAEAGILRDEAVDQALTNTPLSMHYELNAIRKTLHDQIDQVLWLPDQVLRDHWAALYEQIAGQAVTALAADPDFVAALRWQPDDPPDRDDKLAAIWYGVQERAGHLLGGEPESTLTALRWCGEQIKINVGGKKAWHDQVTDAKQVLSIIRDKANATLVQIGSKPGEVDDQAAELVPAWVAAVQAAQASYRQLKERQNALDFADLERLACGLLSEQAVQARYRGVEFQHVLVDEFQDTNAAQRDIVYGLTGLANAGRLFVVGDSKQSIYAFRGADVSVFEQVRREIVETGGIEIALTTSFRAHHSLVAGLNAIFSRLLVSNEYGIGYGAPMIAHRASVESHSPPLDLIILDKKRARPGEEKIDAMRRWEAVSLTKRFKELIAAGWPIWDKRSDTYRPIQYGDMAVLFRAYMQMPFVEEAFKAEDVPYVTVAGKGYYNRPEVWDLLNLLKALYNPADELSLASALRSPLYNLSDDSLYALRLITNGKDRRIVPLWDALLDSSLTDLPGAEQIAFARQSLARLRMLAGRVTIAELLSRALEETALLGTLTGLPDGARRVGNVEKLLEVARRSRRTSLGDFTLYLQDLSERETREGEAPLETEGAVQLMTIHASKGLEFPVVALFESSYENNGHDPAFSLDAEIGPICQFKIGDTWQKPFAYRLAAWRAEQRQDAERLRLFYVGATRAQDRLIMTGHNNHKSGTWLTHLQAALDLTEPQSETATIEQEWGAVGYTSPLNPPDPERTARSRPLLAWDTLGTLDASALSQQAPPLLQPTPHDEHAPAQVLNASEIALLGEVHAQQPRNFTTFRQHVLRAAPTAIQAVIEPGKPESGERRAIGEIVRQAVQWQHVQGDPIERLRTFAWEQGVTDAARLDEVVKEAEALYQATQASPFMQRLSQAKETYRDLPFTLRLNGRTINGKIELLFRTANGRWTVLDYKTDQVEPDFVHYHSRRYHMQIGLYAAAVEELTGQAPETLLHYIRPTITVTVSEGAWREALAGIEDRIAEALSGQRDDV